MMVQELLDLKNKVDKIIVESFQNHEKFHSAVRVRNRRIGGRGGGREGGGRRGRRRRR